MGFLELLGGVGARFFKYYTDFTVKDPINTQIALLRGILKLHQSTLFGQKHKFRQIQTIVQFQKRCPVCSYDYIKPYLEQFFAGTKNALFNSHLLYFAQTSGTTGTPKLIPITFNTLTNYSLGVLRTVTYYISEDIKYNSKIIGGKWLYLPAPPILRYRSGIPIGYITGLLMLPYGIQVWHYPLNYKCYAPLHLMHIKDTEEKFRRITRESISKDIRVLVGVTPVVINLLEYFLKFTGAKKIEDLFPNLRYAIFSGVPPKFYESRITNLVGHPLEYRETYAASEGMLAMQLSKDPYFTPMYDSVFFEFSPLEEPAERVMLHQTKKGREYRVIITAHNGLYAYDLGDIVKFVSEDPPRFIFAFREGVVDLTDEKLTPAQVHSTVEMANAEHKCSIIDFCVVGTYQPKPHWIFVVEFVKGRHPESIENYLTTLDQYLIENNNIYYQNRAGANKGTLSAPELWVLEKQAFAAFERKKILEGRPAGQIKTTHLTKDVSLLEFFQQHLITKISL